MLNIVSSKIIDGFLSDQEIRDIKQEFMTAGIKGDAKLRDDCELLPSEYAIGVGTVSRTILQFHPKYHKNTVELLKQKVSDTFGKEINLAHAHMLTSYIPYRIHTDGLIGEHGITEGNYGAYTLLIPLDDYDTHTIVFNEWQDNDKLLPHYTEKNQPKDTIDDETYEKYFKAEQREHLRYLSIDKIFKWKRGSCLAMSRYVFHGSDNYFGRIPFKQGIVMWTAAPIGWVPAT